jgi:hypothetical protein
MPARLCAENVKLQGARESPTIERPDRAMAKEAVTVTLQRLDERGGGAPFRSSPSAVRLPIGTR